LEIFICQDSRTPKPHSCHLNTSTLCQVFKLEPHRHCARCQVTSLFVLGLRHVRILLTNRYFQNLNTELVCRKCIPFCIPREESIRKTQHKLNQSIQYLIASHWQTLSHNIVHLSLILGILSYHTSVKVIESAFQK
jgi:hypothetical protein